jgi:NADH-quinone oxidoreductase subunit F
MSQILRRLEAGDAEQHELDLLLDVCDRINGKCLCPLGETAAVAVASYVAKFRGEFQAHIDHGGCPFGDSSPLHAVLAPVAQHTHHPTATVPA